MKSIVLTCLAVSMLAACSDTSNPGDEGIVPPPIPTPGTISGRLYDRLGDANPPVSGASLFTSPSTTKVFSNLDGTFSIVDPTPREGTTSYDLFIEKAGFRSIQQRVVVAEGSGTQMDIPMSREGVDVVALPTAVDISFERNVGFFYIHGNSAQVNFDITSSVPWLVAEPSSGMIFNSGAQRVRLQVDRSQLGNTATSTQLKIETDTGDAVFVNIDVAVEGAEPPRPSAEVLTGRLPVLRENQADCRRPDILQIAGDNPDLPLVVFPQTTLLPGDEGSYTLIQIPGLIYTDSFEVTVPGRLDVRHLSGGLGTSTSSIFDLDQNGVVTLLADDMDSIVPGRRSELSIDLEPGLYCYLLRPEFGVFTSFGQIRWSVEFTL